MSRDIKMVNIEVSSKIHLVGSVEEEEVFVVIPEKKIILAKKKEQKPQKKSKFFKKHKKTIDINKVKRNYIF
ncbi:hypothetical protein LCGC14_1279400 [marine sediment metagenome]|uniref:Uncharacterized protein n=1 Tax=marine sediment metagenome TaxID=412755 RepID=A0A0F9KVN7_9ZZZZ